MKRAKIPKQCILLYAKIIAMFPFKDMSWDICGANIPLHWSVKAALLKRRKFSIWTSSPQIFCSWCSFRCVSSWYIGLLQNLTQFSHRVESPLAQSKNKINLARKFSITSKNHLVLVPHSLLSSEVFVAWAFLTKRKHSYLFIYFILFLILTLRSNSARRKILFYLAETVIKELFSLAHSNVSLARVTALT